MKGSNSGREFFRPTARSAGHNQCMKLKEDCMQQDRPPLTFRQQGILAAVMGVAMLGFYTLLGVL